MSDPTNSPPTNDTPPRKANSENVWVQLADLALRLNRPLQLAGFVAVIAAIVMVSTGSSDHVVSQLAAAGAGIAMILMAMLLGQMKDLSELPSFLILLSTLSGNRSGGERRDVLE